MKDAKKKGRMTLGTRKVSDFSVERQTGKQPLLTNPKLWFCSYPFSPSPWETPPSLHTVASLMKKKNREIFIRFTN